MGTFSRLRYVITANVNSLLEKAEDPEKLLKALIREMEDAAEDARLASADLLGEQSHLQRMKQNFEREISEWKERAEKAVTTRRDDLARAALRAKSELEQALRSGISENANLDVRIAQLETDMQTLKSKLGEARLRLKSIQTSRQTSAKGPAANLEQSLSPSERKIRRAMGRFDRLQSQVERLEARVRSYEFGGAPTSSWEAEELPANPEIEAELEQLKKRIAPESTTAAESEAVAVETTDTEQETNSKSG
jgi:phage shock protein A